MAKNKFVIPTSYEQLGAVIKVSFDKDPPIDDVGNLGVHVLWQNKIRLYLKLPRGPISRTSVEQTFCHELVHGIFHNAGYPKLRDDEEVVDRVALLLHQALVTMEGSAIPDETEFPE